MKDTLDVFNNNIVRQQDHGLVILISVTLLRFPFKAPSHVCVCVYIHTHTRMHTHTKHNTHTHIFMWYLFGFLQSRLEADPKVLVKFDYATAQPVRDVNGRCIKVAQGEAWCREVPVSLDLLL